MALNPRETQEASIFEEFRSGRGEESANEGGRIVVFFKARCSRQKGAAL